MILTWYKRTLKANIPIPTLTFQALDPTQGGTRVSTVSLLGTAQLLSSLSSQILSALRAAPDFPQQKISRASRGLTSLLGTEQCFFSTQKGRNFYPNQRDFEEIYHETTLFLPKSACF